MRLGGKPPGTLVRTCGRLLQGLLAILPALAGRPANATSVAVGDLLSGVQAIKEQQGLVWLWKLSLLGKWSYNLEKLHIFVQYQLPEALQFVDLHLHAVGVR